MPHCQAHPRHRVLGGLGHTVPGLGGGQRGSEGTSARAGHSEGVPWVHITAGARSLGGIGPSTQVPTWNVQETGRVGERGLPGGGLQDARAGTQVSPGPPCASVVKQVGAAQPRRLVLATQSFLQRGSRRT